MSIQYPGGSTVNTTFVGATKQDIVSNLETQLALAGWSVVSGSGSTDVLMQSASTPTAGNFIRVRLRSTNLTNCACANMQNAAGDRVSQNYFLLSGAAKTYRIVANRYHWFCFTPGSSAAREFVCMGTLHIPTFLHGVIANELGFVQGNSSNDGSTSVTRTFRASLSTSDNSWNTTLCNGSMYDHNGGGGALLMDQRLIVPQTTYHQQPTIGYRWHDDSLLIGDPLLAFGSGSSSEEAKIKGQLWGAMVLSAPFAADTVLLSVDGHDWMAITNSNAGNPGDHARGTLFLAIT